MRKMLGLGGEPRQIPTLPDVKAQPKIIDYDNPAQIKKPSAHASHEASPDACEDQVNTTVSAPGQLDAQLNMGEVVAAFLEAKASQRLENLTITDVQVNESQGQWTAATRAEVEALGCETQRTASTAFKQANTVEANLTIRYDVTKVIEFLTKAGADLNALGLQVTPSRQAPGAVPAPSNPTP